MAHTDATFLGLGTPNSVRQALRNPDQVQNAEHVIAQHVQAIAGNEPKYRRNFLQRVGELKDVDTQGTQIVDSVYYNTKSIGGQKNVKMFVSNDRLVDGICNISDGKLEKDKDFCMGSIQILYGVNSIENGTDPSNIDFAAIDKCLRNGQISFKANGRTVLEKVSMEIFRTPTNEVIGRYDLSNPKMIHPGVPIEMVIEWGTAAPKDSWIKAVLWGAGLEKA